MVVGGSSRAIAEIVEGQGQKPASLSALPAALPTNNGGRVCGGPQGHARAAGLTFLHLFELLHAVFWFMTCIAFRMIVVVHMRSLICLVKQGGRGEGFSCAGGRGATPGRSPMVAGAAACGGAGRVPAQDGIQAAADAGLRLAPPFSAVCRRQEAVVIRHGGSSRGQPV